MVDDPRKPRRAGTFGDDVGRALAHRSRTPRAGVPVHVAIDDDVTPPPRLPPTPPASDKDARLSRIEAALEQSFEAFSKLWDARKDGDRLDRIESKLGTLADMATRHDEALTQFVVPGIKDTIAAVDSVEREMRPLAGQVETMANIVKDVDKRLRDLELDVRSLSERFASSSQAVGARLTAAENVLNALDVRLTALEQKGRDETVAVQAVSDSDKRRLAFVRTALVIGSGIAGFLVAKGPAILAYLSGLVN